MNFTDFTAKTDNFSTKTLGGKTSQFKMVPKIRQKFSEESLKKNTPKLAGVLVLFYPDENNNTHFLLTKRASYKGTHSSQISFPGGKKEINDTSLKETALRESEEEVGIIKDEVQFIRQLTPTYIPPSNFLVTPFLSFTNQKPNFKANYEVDTIISVSLNDLLDDNSISFEVTNTSYMNNLKVPCFKLNNYVVWGATAMILSEIKDLMK